MLLQDSLLRAAFSPVISITNTVPAQRAIINFNERVIQSYNARRNLSQRNLTNQLIRKRKKIIIIARKDLTVFSRKISKPHSRR